MWDDRAVVEAKLYKSDLSLIFVKGGGLTRSIGCAGMALVNPHTFFG